MGARTGDTVGGPLNATLDNLTELVIGFAALRAGQHVPVKASMAGAIVINRLFILGASIEEASSCQEDADSADCPQPGMR